MPLPSVVRKNTGVSGLAEVRVLEKLLRVIFLADKDTYEVNKNGWDRPTGIYNITLSKGNDEIKFVSPPGGGDPFLVKFLEFGNRIGKTETTPGVPDIKMKPGGMRPSKNGGSYYQPDEPVASAKLIVVGKGPYKGLSVPYELPYVFAQYPGTMIAMTNGSAGQNKKWEDFLRAAGFDFTNDEIPWSTNVLPSLEVLLQSRDKVFTMRLNEKGYVAKDGIGTLPDYLITPELLGEETVKKATKKAPAKKAAAKKKVATKK